ASGGTRGFECCVFASLRLPPVNNPGRLAGGRCCVAPPPITPPAPADRQQRATAPGNELLDIPQLFETEECRLHAANNEPVVFEQLLGALRESGGQFVRAIYSMAVILSVHRPHKLEQNKVLFVI